MAEAVDNWKFTGAGAGKLGPTLASAAVMVPTNLIHKVTGAVAITNITPPVNVEGWAGTIIFIAAAGSAFTWTAAGTDDSIAIASAAAPSVGKAVHFTYDPTTRRWHPSSTVAA
jgi:hypothetical protein